MPLFSNESTGALILQASQVINATLAQQQQLQMERTRLRLQSQEQDFALRARVAEIEASKGALEMQQKKWQLEQETTQLEQKKLAAQTEKLAAETAELKAGKASELRAKELQFRIDNAKQDSEKARVELELTRGRLTELQERGAQAREESEAKTKRAQIELDIARERLKALQTAPEVDETARRKTEAEIALLEQRTATLQEGRAIGVQEEQLRIRELEQDARLRKTNAEIKLLEERAKVLSAPGATQGMSPAETRARFDSAAKSLQTRRVNEAFQAYRENTPGNVPNLVFESPYSVQDQILKLRGQLEDAKERSPAYILASVERSPSNEQRAILETFRRREETVEYLTEFLNTEDYRRTLVRPSAAEAGEEAQRIFGVDLGAQGARALEAEESGLPMGPPEIQARLFPGLDTLSIDSTLSALGDGLVEPARRQLEARWAGANRETRNEMLGDVLELLTQATGSEETALQALRPLYRALSGLQE